jgi:hypothetical protein
MGDSQAAQNVRPAAPGSDGSVSSSSKTDAPAALTFPASDPPAEGLVTGVRIDTEALQHSQSGPVAVRLLLACGIQSAFEASRQSAVAINAGADIASSGELKALLADERRLGAEQQARLQRALNELGEARLEEVSGNGGVLEALRMDVPDPGVRDLAIAMLLISDRLRAAAVAEVLLLLAPHVMLIELQQWLTSSKSELLSSASALAEFVKNGSEAVSGDAIPRPLAVSMFA